MPRLNKVNPDTDTGAGAEILNGPLKQKQINIFKHLATNPAVLQGFLEFSQALKKSNGLNDQELEVVALTVGQQNNCEYCLSAHTKMAEGTGLNDDEIVRIRRGEGANDKHQSLIDFVQAIVSSKGFVTDQQLQSFKSAGYDDAAVIEVIGAIAANTFTNYFNHVNETEVDFPVAAAV